MNTCVCVRCVGDTCAFLFVFVYVCVHVTACMITRTRQMYVQTHTCRCTKCVCVRVFVYAWSCMQFMCVLFVCVQVCVCALESAFCIYKWIGTTIAFMHDDTRCVFAYVRVCVHERECNIYNSACACPSWTARCVCACGFRICCGNARLLSHFWSVCVCLCEFVDRQTCCCVFSLVGAWVCLHERLYVCQCMKLPWTRACVCVVWVTHVRFCLFLCMCVCM